MEDGKMVQRFKIKDDDNIKVLLDKYSYCKPQYATSEDELVAFKAINLLDEYEKIFYFIFVEYKSSRKVANFIGTNNNYASNSIKEIKEIMLNNIKKIKYNDH